jgi:hypothetical protein
MRHGNIEGIDLSKAVEAATTVDAVEKRNSKDGDLEGLPPGHPIRKIIEEAKVNLKSQEEKEIALKATKEKIKARKKKKEEKQKVNIDEIKEKDKKRLKASKDINNCLDDALGSLVTLGKKIESSFDDFDDYPSSKVKLMQLKRLLVSACRMMRDNKIHSKPSMGENGVIV